MRRPVIALLIGLFVTSLLATIALVLAGEQIKPIRSNEHNTFSRSAIGHHAFAEWLRERGSSVYISRYHTLSYAKHTDILLLLEPNLQHLSRKDLEALVNSAPNTLLVLPKHIAPAGDDGYHLSDVLSLSEHHVSQWLKDFGYASVIQLDAEARDLQWICSFELNTTCEPSLYDVQLAGNSYGTKPLLHTPDGFLFAELTERPYRSRHDARPDDESSHRLFVLSDPGLLANHGLHKGHNAALLSDIIDHIHRTSRHRATPTRHPTIVIDEVSHGFLERPTLMGLLTRFPVNLFVIQLLLLATLILWASALRFGPPRPDEDEPRHDKLNLIERGAALMGAGRHLDYLTRQHLLYTTQRVAQQLGAPAQMSAEERLQWLHQLHPDSSALALYERADQLSKSKANAQQWLSLARETWRWRRRLLNAPTSDSLTHTPR
jgi:hypothetical protein